MPVPKSRLKQVGLVQQVASFLQIDTSVVFLDAAPVGSDLDDEAECKRLRISMDELQIRKTHRRTNRRNTLRIWTGNMDGDEKDRIRALKDEVKELASKQNTKIAMSDRHPLGDDGQVAFEERRRKQRAKKWAERKVTK